MTEVAYGLARGLEYTAIALAVGGVAFLFFCWLPALGAAAGVGEESRRAAAAAFAKRLRLFLWIAAGLGLLATAAQIVLEGAEAAGVSGFSAITKTIIEETLETRFGTVWGFAFLAWIAIAILVPLAGTDARDLWVRGPDRRRFRSLYLCLCPALSGHGSSQSPVALNFPVNAIHVAAMAIWLGGLAALLLVLPAATRSATTPADRGRLLAGPLGRFSALALVMVALIMATGLIQAYVYVRHLGDLLSTGYGRAVLAKFLLLLAVIGDRRLQPPGRGAAAAPGRRARRLARPPRRPPAPRAARRGRAARGGDRRHRRAGELRAAGLRPVRPFRDHHRSRPDHARDGRRPGPRRRQPDPHLLLRREDRRSI